MNKQKKSHWHKLLIVISQLSIALSIALSIVLFSCTERHLYDPELDRVRIFPDRALSGLEYRFYGADTCITHSGDAEGKFEGRLPLGTYHVLAANTGLESAAFTGLDTYDGATVSALPAINDTDITDTKQLSLVHPVDNVYSVCVEDLEVRSGIVDRYPLSALLTRELVFVFTLTGGLETEVASIRGVLPGVYPSISLSTGLPGPESLDLSVRTAIGFEVSDGGTRRSVRLNLLGLRDPKVDGGYISRLMLALFMSNGSKVETMIDMTGLLLKIIEESGGVFPPVVYIALELERSSSAGVGGSIKGWGKSAADIEVIID